MGLRVVCSARGYGHVGSSGEGAAGGIIDLGTSDSRATVIAIPRASGDQNCTVSQQSGRMTSPCTSVPRRGECSSGGVVEFGTANLEAITGYQDLPVPGRTGSATRSAHRTRHQPL